MDREAENERTGRIVTDGCAGDRETTAVLYTEPFRLSRHEKERGRGKGDGGWKTRERDEMRRIGKGIEKG